MPSRRDLFKHAAVAAAGLAASRLPYLHAQQPPAGGTSPFFPGFKTFKVQTSGATINGVIGGQGPPLLLLHGAPLSHISWRLIAPDLAKTYTVVATDLRGYGDSSKPVDKPDHSPDEAIEIRNGSPDAGLAAGFGEDLAARDVSDELAQKSGGKPAFQTCECL